MQKVRYISNQLLSFIKINTINRGTDPRPWLTVMLDRHISPEEHAHTVCSCERIQILALLNIPLMLYPFPSSSRSSLSFRFVLWISLNLQRYGLTPHCLTVQEVQRINSLTRISSSHCGQTPRTSDDDARRRRPTRIERLRKQETGSLKKARASPFFLLRAHRTHILSQYLAGAKQFLLLYVRVTCAQLVLWLEQLFASITLQALL